MCVFDSWKCLSDDCGVCMYPANLAGTPGILIFFGFLFIHQGKKRK